MLIKSFWKGRPLSVVERLSISSFLFYGHRFRLYCYDPVEGVPDGVEIADASSIVEFDPEMTIQSGFGSGSMAPFADFFRMTLLAREGGIWTDLDVVCLRKWNELPMRFVATSLEVPDGPLPNINVLGLPRGDGLAIRFLELWRSQRDSTDFASGVRLLGQAIRDSQYAPVMMPPAAFNPISYRHARYLLAPEEPLWHPRRMKRAIGVTEKVGSITSESFGVHLWSEIWRQNQWDRDRRYHPESIFEKLKRRYLKEEDYSQ